RRCSGLRRTGRWMVRVEVTGQSKAVALIKRTAEHCSSLTLRLQLGWERLATTLKTASAVLVNLLPPAEPSHICRLMEPMCRIFCSLMEVALRKFRFATASLVMEV